MGLGVEPKTASLPPVLWFVRHPQTQLISALVVSVCCYTFAKAVLSRLVGCDKQYYLRAVVLPGVRLWLWVLSGK
jgi:hypothetical protein